MAAVRQKKDHVFGHSSLIVLFQAPQHQRWQRCGLRPGWPQGPPPLSGKEDQDQQPRPLQRGGGFRRARIQTLIRVGPALTAGADDRGLPDCVRGVQAGVLLQPVVLQWRVLPGAADGRGVLGGAAQAVLHVRQAWL